MIFRTFSSVLLLLAAHGFAAANGARTSRHLLSPKKKKSSKAPKSGKAGKKEKCKKATFPEVGQELTYAFQGNFVKLGNNCDLTSGDIVYTADAPFDPEIGSLKYCWYGNFLQGKLFLEGSDFDIAFVYRLNGVLTSGITTAIDVGTFDVSGDALLFPKDTNVWFDFPTDVCSFANADAEIDGTWDISNNDYANVQWTFTVEDIKVVQE